MSEDDSELHRYGRVHSGETFLVPVPNKAIGQGLDAVVAGEPRLAEVVGSFRSNLEAVSSVCAMPYYFGNWLLVDRRVNTLGMAHSIEAGAHHTNDEIAKMRLERDSYEKAAAEVRAEGAIPYTRVIAALGPFGIAFSSACEELLREGLVLAWGALEIMASDLFRLVLNARPNLIRRVNSDDVAKRLFAVKSLAIDDLETRAFNVSGAMGDLVLAQHSVDNIPSIKAAYFALCPDDVDLRHTLNLRELFVLNQMRNLIVHRRGIVDADYQKRVGGQLGEKVSIRASELERMVYCVAESGRVLLGAGATLIKDC